MCRGFDSRPCYQAKPSVLAAMSCTVYVLRSLRNGRHYTGFTSRPIERHHAGRADWRTLQSKEVEQWLVLTPLRG